MNRQFRNRLAAAGLAVGTGIAAVTAAGPASAAATTTTALWSFDEVPGTNTAWDGSGYGNNGSVGNDIEAGVRVASGATVYRFPTWASDAAGHSVVVPESDSLDPGRSDFAISLRIRTARTFSNVVQKGQAQTPGGFWKVEVANGKIRCQFKTSNGSALSVSSRTTINDGLWHTIRCGRDGATVTMYVDGERRHRKTGISGGIANDFDLSIGSKLRCNRVTVGCDFFAGDLDYIRVQKG